MTTPPTEIRRASTRRDWDDATALLWDFVVWMRAAVGIDPFEEQPAFKPELDALDRHFSGDDAAMFVAYRAGIAMGIVAVRCHADGSAELKRMYVRPVARGAGLADALIASVVAVAEQHGCHAVWLESVRGPMDPALAVYRRNGFVELDEGGRSVHVEGIVVMERRLHVGALASGERS